MKHTRIMTVALTAALLLSLLGACVKSDDDEKAETSSSAAPSAASAADYSDLGRGLDENGYFEGVRALDFLTLPQYSGIEVPASVLKADEQSMQYQIDSILEKYPVTEKLYDGEVKDGDTINIDYTGTIDGVAFDGGSTNGRGSDVTIGETQFIDNMLPRLTGHRVGETVTLDAHFPENYRSEELRGKDSVFTITINYIVLEHASDTLTDAIAAQLGFGTVAELEADIADWVTKQQKNSFLSGFFSDVEVTEIPDCVMDHVIAEDLEQYYHYSRQYGMPLEGILKSLTGADSLESYISGRYESYTSTAAYYLLIQAIAEKEGLKASDEDIASGGFSASLDSRYVKQYILRESIVPDFIFAHAVIK